MLTITDDGAPNYLCRVVQVDNIRKHSNADRLQIVTIDGANVIVGLDTKLGDIMVFVPTECQLAECFVKENNLFEDKSLNKDTDKKGYINNKRRVRAIKLRGEYSRALLLPIDYFTIFLDGVKFDMREHVGTEFNTVNGVQFSTKYIPPNAKKIQTQNQTKKEKRFNRIIESQFNFHVDTLQIARHLEEFKPEDTIQITHKFHGTSGIAAYVKVRKQVPWWKSIIYKILGEEPTEYGYIASSRKVIREAHVTGGYYKADVWNWALNEVKPHLSKGMTLYYEIVGYVPTSQEQIQKGYDYGCHTGQAGIYVYRITTTNEDGEVFEWTTQQVKEWCNHHCHRKAVPELYYGTVANFLEVSESETLMEALRKIPHMEGLDPLCNNPVPFEGVVIRKERAFTLDVYKLKCEAFYEWESQMLDIDDIGLDAE